MFAPLSTACTAPILAAVVAAPEAAAQQPSAEAIAAFEEGQRRFAEADYEEALASFRHAYELQPAPELHYNIGLSYLRLDRYEEAIEAFERYLSEADPPDRADVEVIISDARDRLEARRAPAPSEAPPPAQTTVDPADGGSSPPGFRPYVVGGGITLGLGLAVGIAGGAGFGAVVADRNEKIREFNRGNPRDLSRQEALDLQNDANNFETLQYVAIGLGSAAAVAGAVVLGIGIRRRNAGRTAAVGPWMGPGLAGLTWRGSF